MSETIDKNLILDSSPDSDRTDVREMILNAMVNGAYSNSTGSRENTDSTSLAAPDWNSMYADMRRNFGNRNSDSNSIFANENTNQRTDDEINGLIWSSLTGEREKDFDRKIEFMPTSADWDRIYSEINKAFGNYSLTGNITNIEPFPINVSSNPYNTYGLATQGYVWYVISRVSGDMGDSVRSVNGVKPDLHRNVDVFKLVTKDYSGEENYVDANLNVLSGGVEYRLITNADLDSSEQSLSSRIDEVSGKVEKISELSGNWENSCFTVESESGNWNSAFSKISESSSDWDATTETVTSSSSNWDSVFTTVQSNSGDWNDAANKEEWDSVYASVHSVSAEWSSASTKVESSSADWDSVYMTVSSASGDWNSAANKEEWDSVYISVNETSGAWDSVYTTVNSVSANWDSAYSTLFSTSGSWNDAFSAFSENSGKWDEGSDVAGSVYSSVETASSEWVNSTSKVESSSADWDSVYMTVSANSGNWELPADSEKWNSVYSSVIGASGDWENSTSKVESSSGDWDSSYGMATVLSEASGGWDDAAISVKSASSDWVWKSGEVENSAILKTTGTGASPFPNVENRAISRFSVSEGASTFSGLKGYRYTDSGNVSGHNYLDFEVNPDGWSSGDVVSVVNDKKYENVLKIASISGNRVNFTTTLPFTSISVETDFDSYMAYVLAKPDSGNTELGYAAHAEGALTRAANTYTHAEGFATSAFGEYSHAEGRGTIAMYAAHAEGRDTSALYEESHAEGKSTEATNIAAHAEGARSKAYGSASHAEGADTVASGDRAHAEGDSSTASGHRSHAEGGSTTAYGINSHAEGSSTTASGNYSHSEGISTIAIGEDSHAEGSNTTATNNHSHAEGSGTMNVGVGAHSEGVRTKTNGDATHAEGYETWAGNDGSSTNEKSVLAKYSHTEGQYTFAKERAAHAEGLGTDSTAISGRISGAFGIASHSEGVRTLANAQAAHSEGQETKAKGAQSHTEGLSTIANNKAEHAQGQFNKSNKADNTFGNAGNTLHSIGIGTSENNRSNAIEVMQDGSVFVKGIGGYEGTNPSTSTSISTKSESWDSVYTTVNSTSANWESVYTTVHSTSSNWKTTEETAGSVYSSVNAASGGWDSVYSTVLAESASWESAENKEEWDETYETVHSLSAGWTDATTKVSASSSNWDSAKETADSTYTTVNAASAGWKLATSKVESSSANWDESAVVSNSVFSTVESASSNWGLATAKVQSSSGSWDSAKTTADSVYSSVSETSGNWDSVYSTVDSASSVWSLAAEKVQSTSGNWDSVYASVESASSGWDEVSTKADLSSLRYDLLDAVNVDSEQSRILSDRAVNSVILTSGSANFIVPPKIDGKVRDFVLKVEKTTLGTISLSGKDSSGQDVSFTDIPEIRDGSILCFTEFTQGKFDISYVNDDSQLKTVESVYSTVEGLSSDWNSVYSTTNGLSSDWNSVYSTVFSNSANWETPGNADEWDSVYATVNSASSDWESVNATVDSLSSNWSSVYSSTFSSSADWNNASTTVQSASGTWETTSNKVSSISPTSDDTQYPTARCLYEIAGTVEEILSSINGDSNWPDMTIFATKVPEATAGNLASLDISGNVADSGIPASSIASIDLLSESISGKQDVSNLVTTIATTSTDEQYPSAKCMYGVVGDAEAALDAILGGGVFPDLTIFATKAHPATSGHFASLDVSGNIQDSGVSPSDFALSSELTGKQDVENLVTFVDISSTDIQYPSAKCLYDIAGNVESALDLINGSDTWPSLSAFATKVISATEGNLAALDANGNIIDSKMPSFGLAYSADLRYDLFDAGNWSFYGVPDGTTVSVTESSGAWYFSVDGTDYAATSSDYGRILSGSITVEGNSYAISSTRFILRDRAVNYLSLSSDQFIGLPEAVPGKARDMLLNLTLVEQTGSVVPVPYLDADVDYETESGEWPDFSTAGRYVVRLTEVMPPVGNENAVFLLQASGAAVAANPSAQTNGGGT